MSGAINQRRSAIQEILGRKGPSGAIAATAAAASSGFFPGLTGSSGFGMPSFAGLSSGSSGFGMPSFAGLSSGSSGFTMPSFAGLSSGSSGFDMSGFSEQTGSYSLQVLFYFTVYISIVFLVAIFVHYSIVPIFRFTPGGKGIIPLPGVSDSVVYWNTVTPLPAESRVPLPNDALSTYLFANTFSFSVDLYVRKLTDTDARKRLILFKTFTYGPDLHVNGPSPSQTATLADPGSADMISSMSSMCSMIMYLTTTNDLVITFFSGPSATNYSCSPIKNIPLYTPFRISVVVEKSIFTVYMNGKQTFQRIVPASIALNSSNSLPTLSQSFYSGPTWASAPTQTVFLHNFILWPRVISYAEVTHAQPALARAEDFAMPAEANTQTC